MLGSFDEYHTSRQLTTVCERECSTLVILFKSCVRCGGDVDATYAEDVYCIQCAHRPANADALAAMASVGITGGLEMGFAASSPDSDDTRPSALAVNTCPRCKSKDLVLLDRLRRGDNVCYRCRPCGHIFSPIRTLPGAGVG